jgi:hypothetical protein
MWNTVQRGNGYCDGNGYWDAGNGFAGNGYRPGNG